MIESFEQLLQMKPSLAEVHGRLGTLFSKAGNLDRARESLRRTIELDPDDQYGHSMLARLALVSSDLESASVAYLAIAIAQRTNPVAVEAIFKWLQANSISP